MQAISSKKFFALNRRYNALMERGRKPTKEAPLFGKQLAYFRKKRGLTQYEFAELLGITRNLVLHYERSCSNPNMEFVLKAAKVLDVSVDELFGLKPEKARRGPAPKVKQLAERISSLPKNKQAVVIEMIESYVDRSA